MAMGARGSKSRYLEEMSKALKVTGIGSRAGNWGTQHPREADLDTALRKAKRLRTSAGTRRETSMSEVMGAHGRETTRIRQALARDKVNIDDPISKMGERMAARLTTSAFQAAKKVEPKYQANPTRTGKLMATGRKKLAEGIRQTAMDPTKITERVGDLAFGKADYTNAPLKTHMHERDAKKVVARVGLAGELPKEYSREQRMGAYEARYVASGGRKGEKWQRRTRVADQIKAGGLAVATAGGAAYLAGKTKRLPKRVSGPKIKSVADTVAIGGATAGGAGELYGYHARKKRASYASAPGGAAASALRRMRAMDQAKGKA